MNILVSLATFGYFVEQQDVYASFGFPDSRPTLIGLILIFQLIFIPYNEVNPGSRPLVMQGSGVNPGSRPLVMQGSGVNPASQLLVMQGSGAITRMASMVFSELQ